MSMNPGDFYIGLTDAEIKLPEGNREITPIPVEITVSNRSANGTLLEDVVRRYTNYQINYGLITGPTHEILKGLYDLNQNLHLIAVNRLGVQESSTVKVTWTSGTRKLTAGNWTWEGDSLLLEVI